MVISQTVEILSMDLRELWNMFKKRADHNDKTYRQARFGIHIHFDINDHINGRITIKPKTGEALIRNNNYRAYKLTDYETELEQRERIISDWLIDNLGEEDIAKPWGMTNDG